MYFYLFTHLFTYELISLLVNYTNKEGLLTLNGNFYKATIKVLLKFPQVTFLLMISINHKYAIKA